MFTLFALACDRPDGGPGGEGASDETPACEVTDDLTPVADLDRVVVILGSVITTEFPELENATVDLEALDSKTDFFASFVDLWTLDAEPSERRYLVQYNPRMFEHPPPVSAINAIVAHELAHVRDYTEMEGKDLAAFGLWYATAPLEEVAKYERATDEAALWKGCGPGLILYREWLYEQIDEETEKEKRILYYTPEEIEAWMAANG